MIAFDTLRLGIVIESGDIPAWQAAIVDSIRDLGFAGIEDFIVVRSKPAVHRPIARAIARRLAGRERAGYVDPLAPVPSAQVLASAANVTVVSADDAPKSIEARVRERGFDVLLVLAACASRLGAGHCPRLGLWYFAAGDRPLAPADGSLVGLEELLERRATLETTLRIRTAEDQQERDAYETSSAVHLRSLKTTCSEHLWKCSQFVSRVLRRIAQDTAGRELPKMPAARAVPARSRGLKSILSLAGYAAWRVRRVRSVRREMDRWILLWDDSGSEPDLERLRQLVPPPGRFWADPHAISVGGVEHVFFEDASADTGKGHIAFMSRQAGGGFGTPVPIVQKPYHLSYPFLFEWRGGIYMIPESAENRTVELYRCTGFPDRWQHEHNLLDGVRAYDVTLVEHDGRWWMFANVAARDGCSSWDELCIFHADSPVSRRWQAHRSNPVISDVRRARPAGAFFREGGALIRPSQDSSERYGHGLNFNRVDELSEHRYRETTVRTLVPAAGSRYSGVHSFSAAGSLVFLDALRRERR